MPEKLHLSAETIASCRAHAARIALSVREETEPFTTLSTERTVMRLLGVDGVDENDIPLPNRVVDSLLPAGKLFRAAALWIGRAIAQGPRDPGEAARALSGPGGARTAAEHPGWEQAR